jgi:hypothetical protein
VLAGFFGVLGIIIGTTEHNPPGGLDILGGMGLLLIAFITYALGTKCPQSKIDAARAAARASIG